jgi:threonine/homoserine/homoserine lactone efflux protein
MRTAAEFAIAAGVLTLIPGPDTLLTIRTALAAGRRSALAAVAGISTAVIGWGCAAGLGLTAALAADPDLYLALRWAGAAYLAGLGLRSIVQGGRWPVAENTGESRNAGRASEAGDAANAGRASEAGDAANAARASGTGEAGNAADKPIRAGRLRPAYLRGVLTCASNPKVGIFYLALFPQFIPPGSNVLGWSVLLASIHAAEGLVWLAVVATLAGRLGRALHRRRTRRLADGVSGAAFLAFAARLVAGG